MLYTVRFTTQKLVKKLDDRGRVVSETRLDLPVCLAALPWATAESFSTCDNYVREIYVPDDKFKRASKGSGRDESMRPVAQKTRRFQEDDYEAPIAKVVRPSKVANAAETGNMASAINA